MTTSFKLMKNNSGAIMVMATFVAIFMVAVVYHVAGVGKAALEQQIVQDGADSVAYSAAAAKARGMNIISLLNLVMAAVLAVLVALRLLQAIIIVAIAVVGVACILTQGAACGAMSPLAKALNKITDITEDVEPRIKDILEGLESAEEAVAIIVPVLSEAEAVYISTRPEYSPVKIGFAFPVVEELPVTEGSFEELCKHAGENVVAACTFLLPGDLPDIAQDTLGKLVGELASTFSSYFCGGSDSSPPGAMTQDVAYPLNDHSECDEASGRPDERTGTCHTSLCETCSSWGCAACISAQNSSDYKKGLWGTKVDVWVEWPESHGGKGVSIEDTGKEAAIWLDDDPCDGEGVCSRTSICSREVRTDPGSGYPEDAERVRKTTYMALHGCVIEEELETEIQGDPLDPDDWPKPAKLDDETLPEGLRVRGFVLAGSDSSTRLNNVAIGAEGQNDFDIPGRIGFAAAEFLSADMDLWHMNWRSRFIRFRAPSEGNMTGGCEGEFSSECETVGTGVSSSFDEGFGGFGLDDYVLH